MLLLELYQVGIVVHGNPAVAHYFYSQASENRKGERKTVHGRFTDILIKEKENGSWPFLSWSGGENPEREDTASYEIFVKATGSNEEIYKIKSDL
jgi:hypothetical protein